MHAQRSGCVLVRVMVCQSWLETKARLLVLNFSELQLSPLWNRPHLRDSSSTWVLSAVMICLIICLAQLPSLPPTFQLFCPAPSYTRACSAFKREGLHTKILWKPVISASWLPWLGPCVSACLLRPLSSSLAPCTPVKIGAASCRAEGVSKQIRNPEAPRVH